MQRDFRRIAIVNRGEPAMRLIHAAREFARENGGPLETIALYTEPDQGAMFVHEADEAVPLGPATWVDPQDGRRKSSYLDYGRLERALKSAEADAVWVGWGFVAEHAAFADFCRDLGIVFIGPSGDVMRRLGDKIASKRLAEEAGVPVAAWSGGPVESVEEAKTHTERLGYPLLIKASAGGGGRGIRKVCSDDELEERLESARLEALRAFGDGTLFLERMLVGARHVEVQIVGDGYGTMWALGVRDCTIQRRNQKVLEEAPSPALTKQQDRDLRMLAARLGEAAGYQNAGTVEFLYDPVTKAFAFMEVNVRLQVEHPVTEFTTGVDIVKLQLHVARGGRLEGEPPESRGHAIEVRINAEDPDNGFAPAPGVVELFRVPTGPGIRVDTGVQAGSRVPPEFDSMVAKILAWGRDRNEALARLRRALQEAAIVIRGGMNNKAFLLELLERPEVQSGDLDIGWLDRLNAQKGASLRRHAEIAILQAAIDVYDSELKLERMRFFTSAARDRPRLRDTLGRSVELHYRGHSYEMAVYRIGASRYRIRIDGCSVDVQSQRLDRFGRRLKVGGRTYRVLTVVHGVHHQIEINGIPHKISRDEGGIIRAPAPAVVLSIPVEPGDLVEAGDRLMVLEAMKMEMSVVAPYGGRVQKILTRANVQVDAGAPLILVDPEEKTATPTLAQRATFQKIASDPAGHQASGERREENTRLLKSLMLGFDVASTEVERILSERRLPAAGDEKLLLRPKEKDLLQIFTDLSSLFRRRSTRAGQGLLVEGRVSDEEYLFTYLRDLDARGEGLPQSFLDKLLRALAHYGVEDLDRSQPLEEALLWIFKARRRTEQQIPAILELLEQCLEPDRMIPKTDASSFRDLLDRLVFAALGQNPALADLAREVRYRIFEQPLFDEVRQETFARMESHLQRLIACPSDDERESLLQQLVDCPQQIVGVFSRRFHQASPEMRDRMLEVIMRRYYCIRNLENIRFYSAGRWSVGTAEYEYDDRQLLLLSLHVGYQELPQAARALRDLAESIADERQVLIDFYVWDEGGHCDQERRSKELTKLLDESFPEPLRRVFFAVAGPSLHDGREGMEQYTFRPSDKGYWEEKLYRGLHPMMGKRLELWRLGNFKIQRLPSVEDLYLFHGVARDNPRDERIFAFAEVWDLTPVRDSRGNVVQLPYLERTVSEALAGIRMFQSHRTLRKRLHWNRVILYVWPRLELEPEDLRTVIRRVGASTAELGLEKITMHVRILDKELGVERSKILGMSNPTGAQLVLHIDEPTHELIRPLSEYERKVVRMRQRGLIYPYEIIRMLTPAKEGVRSEFPPGEFVEYDLDYAQRLVPVQRPYGLNEANLVVGLLKNFTKRYPDGITRVVILGDPSKSMGSLAEPECRRIIQAIDLAQNLGVPVEWFSVSAGAKIAMDSGTENLDWTARVLRRLIEFTRDGGEVNIVAHAVNVGAQSYWNAEATMLMHTRGILIMIPEGAMLLTGKKALDYSGGVSADTNQGIGGYEHIMGPNGQAQFWAEDFTNACHLLFRHYEYTYVASGERFPRRFETADPTERDAGVHLHGTAEFEQVADIFSAKKNPARKRPFEIRAVMASVVDQDCTPMERWAAMRDAETAVVWSARLGGRSICLIGIESKNLSRLGYAPADGPDRWTAGTLFPLSSKKVARAINSSSGLRPVVILANLSGFDGSPESMRELQLEHGAEIGRAIVNFRGPVVFCVISRYHGGAYVVFSKALNESVEVAALEGSYASVIGGAPAAAVVFAREVQARVGLDERVKRLEQELAEAKEPHKHRLRTQLDDLRKKVHAEKLGEVAEEFDAIHTVQRAQRVGSIDHILPPNLLRPYLVNAVERGMARTIQMEGILTEKTPLVPPMIRRRV